jgi:hypothetical protein
MRPQLLALGTAIVMAGSIISAQDRIIESMTPEAIKAAIDLGARKKLPETHLIKTASLGSYRLHVATFSTPYMRVAAAARDAKTTYRAFTEADVTPEMIAPELHIYAWPQMDGPEAVGVKAVVITPRSGKQEQKAARAIHPIRFEDAPVVFRNWFGASFEGRGRMAVFPLTALSEENEVHVIYERRVALKVSGSPMVSFSCEDCDVEFKLKPGVR